MEKQKNINQKKKGIIITNADKVDVVVIMDIK